MSLEIGTEFPSRMGGELRYAFNAVNASSHFASH